MNKCVLIPHKSSTNPFFEKVINHSTWQFDYGTLSTSIINYDIILIHWPELLFGWNEPTSKALDDLEQQFNRWKGTVKIVYVVHNERRHFGMTPNFERLYELVISYSDAMIHMGNYSKMKYEKLYSHSKHVVIPHAIYEEPFKVYDKLEARKQLGIDPKKKIVLAAGAIRNIEERQLIINAFKKLRLKHKLLVVPTMFYKELVPDFPGRYVLKKIFDVKKALEYIYNEEYKQCFDFNYSFASNERLSLLFSAADVIMIPRINALNSGNIFLAMAYNKVVIGPDVGNISEALRACNLPVFQPKNRNTVVSAIEKAFVLESKGFVYKEKRIKQYRSKNVGKLWDAFLNMIIE